MKPIILILCVLCLVGCQPKSNETAVYYALKAIEAVAEWTEKQQENLDVLNERDRLFKTALEALGVMVQEDRREIEVLKNGREI